MLRANWKVLVGVFLVLFVSQAGAVEYEVEEALKELWTETPTPAITVPRVEAAPTVDGKLDDEVWEQVSTVDDFILQRYGLMRGQEQLTTCYSLAKANTRVWIGRTDTELLVAFKAWEPEIEALHLDYDQRDGRIWMNDCVEFMLQPKPGLLYHFIVDGTGTTLDQRTKDGKSDRGWNLPDLSDHIAGAVHKNEENLSKSYWVVEMRLPFEQLGGQPQSGTEWNLNFCRERWAPKYKSYSELSSWTGTPSGFSDDKFFGRAVFSNVAVRLPEPAAGGQLTHPFLGQNTGRVQLINRGGGPAALKASVMTTTRGEEESLASDQRRLGARDGADLSLEYVLRQEGPGWASLAIEAGGKQIAVQRRAFKSKDIGRTLARGLENARALQKRSDPESDSGKSVGPYIEELEEIQKRYQSKKEELLSQEATPASMKEWQKLAASVKGALRAGSYAVWTCSPYLPVGHHTYPGELESVSRIDINACVNEYENAALNITNFTDEHMDFYLQGNAPHADCAPRSGFTQWIRPVIQNHGRRLGWTASTKSISSEDDGMAMPLMQMGEDARVHVPPYSTRQVWYTVNTEGVKPTVRAGKKGKPYRSGLKVIPTSHNLDMKVVGMHLNVYDFRIPEIAELGSYSFNYATPMPFLANYKINTFMVAAWPRPKIREDGSVDVSKAARRLARDVKRINPGPDRPFRFVASYGYTGSFMKWAEKRGLEYMSEEWKRLFKAVFKAWIADFKKNGLDYDDFVFQTVDEAHGHQVEVVCETTPLLREVDPNVRTAMTIMCSRKEMQKMAPHVDVWFNRNGSSYNLAFLHEEQDKGKPLYSWHMSGDMHSPVLSWTRTYGWRAAEHNFDNISYFVFSSSCYRWQRENPIPSRMIEGWRDTIEDWQYFNTLRKAMKAAEKSGVPTDRIQQAQAVIDEALKNVLEREGGRGPYFPPDTQATADAVEAERVKIAREIVELRRLVE